MPFSCAGCSLTEWRSKRFGLLVYYTGVILHYSNCKYEDKQNYNDDTCVITCLEYLNGLPNVGKNFQHEKFNKPYLILGIQRQFKRILLHSFKDPEGRRQQIWVAGNAIEIKTGYILNIGLML